MWGSSLTKDSRIARLYSPLVSAFGVCLREWRDPRGVRLGLEVGFVIFQVSVVDAGIRGLGDFCCCFAGNLKGFGNRSEGESWEECQRTQD